MRRAGPFSWADSPYLRSDITIYSCVKSYYVYMRGELARIGELCALEGESISGGMKFPI